MGRQTLLVTQGIELRQKRTSPQRFSPTAIVPITRFALGKDDPRGITQRSHTTRFNTLRPQPTIVGWGLNTDVSRETIEANRRNQG